MAASPQNAMLHERPVLDEATFQQLLAAAFVLQEHNDRLSAKPPKKPEPAPKLVQVPEQPATPDYSRTLSEIVETQALIHTHQLDLQGAILLIAQRVESLTHASAAAIGIIENQQVCYRAVTGPATDETGTRLAFSQTLSAESLRTGSIVECHDTQQDPSVATELWVRTATRSFISVPIYHENRIAGVLEARFSGANGFHEHDVRTCQLMAGLAGEAISRAAELELKRAIATERATMMEVLERIKPQLDRLATASVAAPRPRAKAEELPQAKPAACRGCGEPLTADEAFCGVCGMRIEAGGDIQSKWASMWHLQEAAQRKKAGSTAASETHAIEDVSEPGLEEDHNLEQTDTSGEKLAITFAPEPAITTALATRTPLDSDARWTSASKARKWLESVSAKHPATGWLARLWKNHRAKFYMVISALLLLVVMSGWGASRSGDAALSAANSQPGKRPHKPNLTFVEQALVTLGVAEAPPPPQYKGNPDTPVWEDIHTATYYCPGTTLYGKTAGGKYTTQYQAQLEQFEPASRRVCN